MNDTFLFLNLSNLFGYVNLALGFSILLYLRHFISYQQIAQRSQISTFVPILTHQQSYLFVTGFTLWTIALFSETVRGTDFLVLPGAIRDEVAFFIHLTRPLLLTASTMFIGHALMVFAALPVREGKIAPNLNRIGLLRKIGLLVLMVIWIIPVSIGPAAFDTQQNWMLYMTGLVIAQWTIITHVAIKLRNSMHPMRPVIFGTLTIWAANIVAQMSWFTETSDDGSVLPSLITLHTPSSAWMASAVTTITLMLFLSLLLRANFLYVQETFRRASSHKKEKEVMVSFLHSLSERSPQQAGDRVESSSVLERQDINHLANQVLDFGREITNASGGVMYLRDDINSIWRDTRGADEKGVSFSASALFGLYPPQMSLSALPQETDLARNVIHAHLRTEKFFLGEGLIGRIAKTGTSLLLTHEDDRSVLPMQRDPRLQIRTWLAVPVQVQDTTLAVVCLANKDQGRKDFAHEDEAIVSALAEQAAISLQNLLVQVELRERDRLAHEVELARHVQQLLLPAQCPRIEGYDIAAISSPAQDVSGDYFDFLWLSPDRLLIVVADVSDKGIPGALNMATVRSALRSHQHTGKDVREILISLNQFIQPDIPRGMFVSMLLVALDVRTGQMDIARAGHEPLIIQRDGESDLELLTPDGIALGVVNGSLFNSNLSSESTILREGERIILFTDGITESINTHYEEYSMDRFLDQFRIFPDHPADEMISRIQQSVSTFSEGMPQHDDQTLVIIQRMGDTDRQKNTAA